MKKSTNLIFFVSKTIRIHLRTFEYLAKTMIKKINFNLIELMNKK